MTKPSFSNNAQSNACQDRSKKQGAHQAPSIANVLTIAGSDSGGGAGIQADIKAISATGSYACSVITALTAQNTQGVSAIYPISAGFVEQQLDAIFSDIKVDAVKIGMLNDSQIIQAISKKIKQYSIQNIVIDPVMVATSGDPLIDSSAIAILKNTLFPYATLITPNLPEAALLLGIDMPKDESEIEPFIAKLRLDPQLKSINILLKGGHFTGEQSTDWLVMADDVQTFTHQRVATNNTHGTGCTLSSAIASFVGQGNSLPSAIEQAKRYLSNALEHADTLNVGKGSGPVHHFYTLNPASVNQTPVAKKG